VNWFSHYLHSTVSQRSQQDLIFLWMKLKMLVVEDEADFAELAEYRLVNLGFEVVCARNGEQALVEAGRTAFDGVLLDLLLPDADGYSVCEQLREQQTLAQVPIFIVSALDGLAARERGLEAGATCFFRKPADFRALGQVIRETIECQQTLRRLAAETGGDASLQA
jgi:DNA-binding response OmpR family regulator